MNSFTVRRLIARMSPEQKVYLREQITLKYAETVIFGGTVNEAMLQFIEDELDGKKPKLLERRRKCRNKSGKLHIVKGDRCVCGASLSNSTD